VRTNYFHISIESITIPIGTISTIVVELSLFGCPQPALLAEASFVNEHRNNHYEDHFQGIQKLNAHPMASTSFEWYIERHPIVFARHSTWAGCESAQHRRGTVPEPTLNPRGRYPHRYAECKIQNASCIKMRRVPPCHPVAQHQHSRPPTSAPNPSPTPPITALGTNRVRQASSHPCPT
jgi:hypothetical protein